MLLATRRPRRRSLNPNDAQGRLDDRRLDRAFYAAALWAAQGVLRRRMRTADDPRSARTTSASRAASWPRTRRTKWPGRCSGGSLPCHPRQCGLLMLRIFLTGWPSNCGEQRYAPPRQNKLTLTAPSTRSRASNAVSSAYHQRRPPAKKCSQLQNLLRLRA